MGIMTRIFRLCKADVHGVMDQLEDTALLQKQYLREMADNLRQKQSRLHQLDQAVGRAQHEHSCRQAEMAGLEKDLALALRKEKDDIARMLIRKLKAQQTAAEHQNQYLQKLRQNRDDLAKRLEEQHLQFDALKVSVAASSGSSQQQRFDRDCAAACHRGEMHAVSEEEIELELLRRKEALVRNGGAA